MVHALQGQTKREGYFPKGKWYNLFDNTTVDTHDGGKFVTLDLPMGHVGVHMPAGTILPLQQAALVTADVRASALTLLVALPHLEPLPAFTDTTAAASSNLQDDVRAHSSLGQQQEREGNLLARSQRMQVQEGGRKLLATSSSQPVLAQQQHAEAAGGLSDCGVVQAGRVTACGHIYMDDGDQLQVRLTDHPAISVACCLVSCL